ncbi:type III-B CRISPR module-associated protein Cmr5 [Allorhodopirellula heiligendammensis]|uniref:CRISPR type III-B/RAMP module-associated protein Cmr5 n=1 Tax=Allorhodopirellula heiligendammensis TaxID=2714739 RepID=A0A5C6C1G4_9BACT|nr:type III-B CRISPR module-associated protein Cmr5 [Allorhodopirellula heiligendammensis]TWU17955.1 CRISPR-associated protein [Allorhodopirellula heiligendammensis]
MNTTATKPTLDQQRAAHALQMIQKINSDNYDGMYVSYVSALPATIAMNGIGQALATELAKDKGKKQSHRYLFDHVTDWLTTPGRPLESAEKANDPQSVFRALTESQEIYIAAQIEAMAYIHWLKQFSRAFLVDRVFDEGGSSDE